MLRSSFIVLTSVFSVSCSKPAYIIELSHVQIDNVRESGGNGYVIVDKVSAENMARSGDVYVNAKLCVGTDCEVVPIGEVKKYDQQPTEGGVKMNVSFHEMRVTHDYPQFWLSKVACLKLEAVKGFMGREGRSRWNCSVTFAGVEQPPPGGPV